MHDADVDRAAVIAPPPLIYLVALGAGLVIDWFLPLNVTPRPPLLILGIILVLNAIALIVWTTRSLWRRNTTLDVYSPTTALVTDGPYRFSRNPVYVALTMLYVGTGCLLSSGWVVLMTVPALGVMHFGVIHAEESYLQRTFGTTFTEYRKRVPRWL